MKLNNNNIIRQMGRKKKCCNESCSSSSSSCSSSASSCSSASSASGGSIRQNFAKARVSAKPGCVETVCVPTGFVKSNRCKKKDVTSQMNNLLQTELNKRINVLQAESGAIGQETSIHNANKIAKKQAKVAFQIVNAKINAAVSTALNIKNISSKEALAILNNDIETILTAQGSANQSLQLALDAIVLGCAPPQCPPTGGGGGSGGMGTCSLCPNPLQACACGFGGTPFTTTVCGHTIHGCTATALPPTGGGGGSGCGCQSAQTQFVNMSQTKSGCGCGH